MALMLSGESILLEFKSEINLAMFLTAAFSASVRSATIKYNKLRERQLDAILLGRGYVYGNELKK